MQSIIINQCYQVGERGSSSYASFNQWEFHYCDFSKLSKYIWVIVFRAIYFIGCFHLVAKIIREVKSHMIPYKFKCSHWLKLQHSDWRANLVKDFFLQINFPPMRALEFIRDHVTFKLPYDFSYHMKTPMVRLPKVIIDSECAPLFWFFIMSNIGVNSCFDEKNMNPNFSQMFLSFTQI